MICSSIRKLTMSQSPKRTTKKKPDASQATPKPSDDFVSVARRLGADDDKAGFEEKLGKLARPKFGGGKWQ